MENTGQIIPRNLLKRDNIDIGFGLKIGLRNVPFLSIGMLTTIITCTGGAAIIAKIIISIVSIVASYMLSEIPVMDDQKIDEVIINSISYAKNKFEYYRMNKRGDINVTTKSLLSTTK